MRKKNVEQASPNLRVENKLWKRLKARAKKERRSANSLGNSLIEGGLYPASPLPPTWMPAVVTPRVVGDCGCPVGTVCNSVACPRQTNITCRSEA